MIPRSRWAGGEEESSRIAPGCASLCQVYTSTMDDPQREAPFLKRVKIRDYKSIATADVELGPLTVLVGRNGSGKSNFLDALRFIADGLQTSLDHAVKSRGGFATIRRFGAGPPGSFAIALEVPLPGGQTAFYELEIAERHNGGVFIPHESLKIESVDRMLLASYEIASGRTVKASIEHMPFGVSDRLYLVLASGFPQFRTVYNFLASMGFYNLNPEAMKKLQSPDAGEILHRDGDNIASVVSRLNRDQPKSVERILSYLTLITPGIESVRRAPLGSRQTVSITQDRQAFLAESMSDGTLRALGILFAVIPIADQNSASLVGVEEPETALHPAAARALMDALREASSHTQILVTSHSPDLLDQMNLENDHLLAVVSQEGVTQVAPIDDASLEAIQAHLYSPGELLRLDQIEPSKSDLKRQIQIKLFPGDSEA